MRHLTLVAVLLLFASPLAAQTPRATVDADPPPGYPAGFPYLPTHHGLSGQKVAWPASGLCEVISLAYSEPASRMRERMRRGMVAAGWRIVRDQREAIDGKTKGFAIEGKRTGYGVTAIIVPRGRASTVQIYDCGGPGQPPAP